MGLFSLVHLFVNEFRSRWERSIGFLPLIQTCRWERTIGFLPLIHKSVGADYWVSPSYSQVGGSELLGFSLLSAGRWEWSFGFLPPVRF